MHRFYLPPEQCRDATLVLTGSEGHHALRVLRLRSGDSVTVLDGAGNEFLCETVALTRREARLAILAKNSAPTPACRITLAQALPKGRVIESIVQKATELGAHRIVPLLTDRVAVHLDVESAATKAEKWRQTAIEAIKQCGAPWLPQIEAPIELNAFLRRKERFDLSLVASLQEDRRHPREYFSSFSAEHRRAPQSICAWVGPEGDFTPAELNAILSSGAKPVTLGHLVLRSETAAIYCLSILNYELQALACQTVSPARD